MYPNGLFLFLLSSAIFTLQLAGATFTLSLSYAPQCQYLMEGSFYTHLVSGFATVVQGNAFLGQGQGSGGQGGACVPDPMGLYNWRGKF